MLVGAVILFTSCSSSKQVADTPTPAAPPAPASQAPARRAPEVPLVAVARVYLDRGSNLHVVQVDSQDIRVTFQGRYLDPQLSPDRHTVGVLAADSVDNGVGDTVEVANKLKLLRGGGFVQEFEPGGFIRSWSFARDGKAVAIYSGGLHFAGTYELYDTVSGAMLEYAKDPVTDTSPDWVRALSP
ncbi:MAG TPA: hypothetical protein VFR25_02335 [Candidatus Eisenbacteria bacterium]|nr:hypothetical protein [Candidatus Eisenbacteria bacterium]